MQTEYRFASGDDLGRAVEDGVKGPCRYRYIKDPAEASRLVEQMSNATSYPLNAGGAVAAISFQPCTSDGARSQDRHSVQQWDLPDGVWTFTAVYDGHGGHENVSYVAEELPIWIRNALEKRLSQPIETTPEDIRSIITHTMSAFDDELVKPILDLFPDGIDKVSDEACAKLFEDPLNKLKLRRCMTGSAVLVTLLNPAETSLYWAWLGDCIGVAFTLLADGWEKFQMTSPHACDNEAERQRLLTEHPDEPELMKDGRVLGGLAMTRSLGDHKYKMSAEAAQRLYPLCFENPGPVIAQIMSRVKTPPYVSGIAACEHGDAGHGLPGRNDERFKRFLVLATDGIWDLWYGMSVEEVIDRWLAVVTLEGVAGPNAALRLLRDGLGGEDLDKVSKRLLLELDVAWLDDTTILVQPF